MQVLMMLQVSNHSCKHICAGQGGLLCRFACAGAHTGNLCHGQLSRYRHAPVISDVHR